MKAIRAGMLALGALGFAACSHDSTAPRTPSYSAGGLLEASAGRGGARTGFGFNGTVSGFPTGAVFLTGGGSFDAASASNVVPSETDAKSGGGFRCTAAVAQGPLKGCAEGEGVRWDTAQLLASTTFKCTGADAGKPAATGAGTVVLLADFYRAGDGNDESFTAQMIVSDHDIAPDIAGEQTLWVQGVGCSDALAHFSR
ncbi:MAG TPA: hypothetical protein VGU74_17175 [Gemmatimonadales bacterium]|nr:hypothetical protein [Gemmatimonadales bacterium]